jgi:septum formation inhibitor MinC
MIDLLVMQQRLQQMVPRAVPPAGTNEATYFVRKNLRSGTAVNYPQGNVVVLGDVNPGSAVIAGGDIAVWGRCEPLTPPCC